MEENKKFELDDSSPLFLVHDFKDVLQELYNHYRSVVSTNEYLGSENERLKSEAYKDEELSTMKEKYDKMRDDYYRGFPISEKEMAKIHEWQDKIIGGVDMKINGTRFHYEFYPTPLGVSGKVVDNITGEKFEFQEIG